MSDETTSADVLLELRKLHRRLVAATTILTTLILAMGVSLYLNNFVVILLVSGFALLVLSLGIFALQSRGRAYHLLRMLRFRPATPEDVMETEYRDTRSQLDD